MTITHLRVADRQYDERHALAAFGDEVDCSVRRIPLRRPGSLWLVAEGEFDLFAVDETGGGPWHHIARLTAGVLCPTPAASSRHGLILRPLDHAQLRRLSVSEVIGKAKRHKDTGAAPGPLVVPLTEGIDRGMSALMDFVRAGLPPRDYQTLVPDTEIILPLGERIAVGGHRLDRGARRRVDGRRLRGPDRRGRRTHPGTTRLVRRGGADTDTRAFHPGTAA